MEKYWWIWSSKQRIKPENRDTLFMRLVRSTDKMEEITMNNQNKNQQKQENKTNEQKQEKNQQNCR